MALENLIYHKENESCSKTFRDIDTDYWYYEYELVSLIGQEKVDILKGKQPLKTVTHTVKSFSDNDMISFGTFIRENYYQYGLPCLLSYHPLKYPHGKIEDIFVIWCCENGH